MKAASIRLARLRRGFVQCRNRRRQAVSRGTRPVFDVAQQLKTGEYVWAPELSPEGPALLVVNLATQRAILFRNGVPMAASTVSSGKAGHETPTGVFTILQKNKEHYSSTYNNAPMPNMQRLTWKGDRAACRQAAGLPGLAWLHPAADEILSNCCSAPPSSA